MRCNAHVVHADRLAEFFQGGANGAVVLRGLGAVGQNFEATAKVLDGGQVLAHAAAFFGTVQELGEGDGGHGHAAGVEGGKHLDRSPLQHADDDVRV